MSKALKSSRTSRQAKEQLKVEDFSDVIYAFRNKVPASRKKQVKKLLMDIIEREYLQSLISASIPQRTDYYETDPAETTNTPVEMPEPSAPPLVEITTTVQKKTPTLCFILCLILCFILCLMVFSKHLWKSTSSLPLLN